MSAVVLVVALGAVALAGMVQRVSGIGYALVASPVLIAAVGPQESVRLVILTGIVSAALGLVATWRDATPRQVLPIALVAVAVVWPAGLLAAAMSAAVASLVAGLVVLLALAVAYRPRVLHRVPSWAQAAVAGGLSGAMNTVAALGGPMGATYGLAHRWGRAMVPNMQLFLLVTSAAVLVVRGWPQQTGPAAVLLLAAGAAGGVVLGSLLSGRLTARHATRVTVVVAVAGAGVAIARGVAGLL